MERNLLLTIEYDGSDFSGWQKQPSERTIQEELEKALSTVCGCDIKVNGTSRTDAGVHALGQRASFKGDFGIPTDRLLKAVNNLLSTGGKAYPAPGEIRVVAVEEKPLDFHARFDSKGKKYRYVINNSKEADIFRRKYCYHVAQPLDVEAMEMAAKHIVGTHDFASFQSSGASQKETTVRTVHSLDIFRQGEDIVLEIAGDGFLYNMVRIITGTLVEVGLGRREPESLAQTIASGKREMAGHRAPAGGLYLVEVYY